MTFPPDAAMKQSLLRFIASQPGGRAAAKKCYGAVASDFSELTEADLAARLSDGRNKWENLVQYTRLHLVQDGLLFKKGAGPMPSTGVWILTPAGVRAAERGSPIERHDRPSARVRGTSGVVVKSMAHEGDGILLGWNRDVWDGWPDGYEGVVNRLMADDRYTDRWSVGKRVDVPPGTDAWLLRQGGPFGVIGHGTVTSNTFVDAHFANEGDTSRYVNVEFDVLLNEEDILPRAQLELVVPEIKWRHQFTSGNRVQAEVNARLKQLWIEHIS